MMDHQSGSLWDLLAGVLNEHPNTRTIIFQRGHYLVVAPGLPRDDLALARLLARHPELGEHFLVIGLADLLNAKQVEAWIRSGHPIQNHPTTGFVVMVAAQPEAVGEA
jgi:hypothetical protein